MSSLFVIGNGLDLAHGLPTKYRNFRNFLVKEYEADKDISLFPPEIIVGNHGEEKTNSIELASLFTRLLIEANVEGDWSNFEEKLGQLNYDEFYDHIEDFGSDDEENPWITAYRMEDVSSSLLNSIPNVQELFSEWINTIQIESTLPQKLTFMSLCAPKNDMFLNFNYTLTLEKVYGCENVCHIHGKQGAEILVGHGDDSSQAGCFDNDGFPGALCNLTDVKKTLRKDTEQALFNNRNFFESLVDVNKIYSIGFSFSSVDLIYIKEICKKTNSGTIWIFNDYCGDRKEIPKFKNILRK